MDLLLTHSQLQKQNKLPPATTKPPTLTLAKKPEPGPSKPREGGSTIKSPAETPVSHSVVQGSSVNTQIGSHSSRRQTANQATGSDRRIPGKTQVFPYTVKSSSGLSTKARIAEDIAKGFTSHGQSKYKGMRIPKKVNPPGESRSPVMPSAANSQSPLDSPQRAPLPRSSNENNDQTQIKKASLQQRPPPPPQLEELSHDLEPDRMDVDQPEFVHSPSCFHFSNVH